MSLGVVVKAPEGLVLAAESRTTLGIQTGDGRLVQVTFDNATKVLPFHFAQHIGAVTYGAGGIGERAAHTFIPELETTLVAEKGQQVETEGECAPSERWRVEEFAERLSGFFLQQWQQAMPEAYTGPAMTFVVAGFNEGEAYGRVYLIEIPSAPEPVEQNLGGFGITWGGQREFVDRLLQGYDGRLMDLVRATLGANDQQIGELEERARPDLTLKLPLAAMGLQDCVDLALFVVRTTIEAQRLSFGIRGCGGPIDVATITRGKGLRFVQRKRITGERGTTSGGSDDDTDGCRTFTDP